MDIEQIHKKLVEGIRTYFEENRFKKGVLGVSGGLDSAVTLSLAAEALGPQNVVALIMPENGISKPENAIHAKALCDFLGVKYYYVPINPFLLSYGTLPWQNSEIAYMNIKARIRANLLYHYANCENALVLGTSNKSELMLGYGTKHGDLAVDIQVLGDLYKTGVFELAEFMGLPKEIIEKKPSAELSADQTDEEDLGGSYKDIDNILKQADLGEAELTQKGMNVLLIRNVLRRIEQNRHKGLPPKIIKLT